VDGSTSTVSEVWADAAGSIALSESNSQAINVRSSAQSRPNAELALLLSLTDTIEKRAINAKRLNRYITLLAQIGRSIPKWSIITLT
jgi:hypothetical protein